ncbi:nucleolar complex protein 14 [Chytridiales sp. JEL 0842]|nr:nucleolar complex protein 14 [Chytridiales sp. JEL 0842]
MVTANTTKKKGSALKNLKTSLKDAGLLGPKPKGFKKAKTPAARKELAGQRKAIRSTLDGINKTSTNPFEMQYARPKHPVLGRKVKGAIGKPLEKRKIAEEARKKTLAVELKRKNKVSAFIDKRFGENNPEMSIEDKMMERFMKEKLKGGDRGALFNLEDDDFDLTHKGQSLSGMDEFDEDGLGDSDSDNGMIDKETVRRAHFGGFEDENPEDRKKTKNEIMQEVIAKSKFHKHERQKANEDVLKLGEEVDADLEDIRSLLSIAKDENKKNSAEDGAKPKRAPLPSQFEDYDKFISELRFEAKSKPSDRLKSEEEIALEEKNKLEAMERERQNRMLGISTDEDSTKSKKRKIPQADDLDDDFSAPVLAASDDEDEQNQRPLEYKDGVLVNDSIFIRKPIKGKKGEEELGSDEDDDEDEDEDGESGESEDEDEDEEPDVEGSDEEDADEGSDVLSDVEGGLQLGSDNEEEDESVDPEDEEAQNANEKASRLKKDSAASSSKSKVLPDPEAVATIPFTFTAPQTHKDLLNHLKNWGPADQATILHRIRVIYHLKLHPTNKSKLETLLKVLLEHFDYLSKQTPAQLETINALFKHAFELTTQFPYITADHATTRILKMHKRIQKAEEKGAALPWMDDLVLLRLVGRVFSVSDLKHPVGGVAQLLMSEFLAVCPITNGRQALSALLVCDTIREYEQLSKRFVPDVFYCFNNILQSFVDGPLKITTFSTSTKPIGLTDLLCKPTSATQANPNSYLETDEFRVSLLVSLVKLVSMFAKLYSDIPAFIDVFQPLLSTFQQFPVSKMAADAQEPIKAGLKLVESLLASAELKRRPLQLQKRKAIAIETYVPKFQEHYSYDRRFDPNKERQDLKKLQYQHKKEFKGAVRELRKDSAFIARQRLQEKQEKAAVHKKKMDSIMGALANQEGAMRGYEREMGRKKRR